MCIFQKPPLGLRPKKFLNDIETDNDRIIEILDAMKRYAVSNKTIPEEWIEELNDLVHWNYF